MLKTYLEMFEDGFVGGVAKCFLPDYVVEEW